MNIKHSVRFKAINKYGIQFFTAVLDVERMLCMVITITSGNDGVHKPRNGTQSFHDIDQAWDLRINDISAEDAYGIADILKFKLGHGWDVVTERFAGNPANDHIHVERDTRTYPELYGGMQ